MSHHREVRKGQQRKFNNVDIFKDSFGLNENIGAAIASSYSDNSVIVARFSHSFGKIPESSLNY